MIELKAGDIFAGCKIISVSGHGGFGTVYLAENAIGQQVALKIVNTTDKERELRGIRSFMKLVPASPYLLPIHHVGIEQNELFYIMEIADPLPGSPYYIADTLSKRLKLYHRLKPREVLDVIRKIAQSLQVLHRAGLIHRDIKPGNIIFIHGEPVLSDPGLCAVAENSISLAGTPGFMPPECFFGEEKNSYQSDIYALGKCLYCALTGEAPSRFPHLPGDLSSSVCRKFLPVLLKSCNSKKKKRYTDISEFIRDLPEKLPRPGKLAKISESFRQWRLMHAVLFRSIIAGVILIIASIVGSCYYVEQRHRSEMLRIATLRQEVADFRAETVEKGSDLLLQLEYALGEKPGEELFNLLTQLPDAPEKAAARCRELRQMLVDAAKKSAEKSKSNPNMLYRHAQLLAFPDTPLGHFLDPAYKETLKQDIDVEMKANEPERFSPKLNTIYYGSDTTRTFEFSYIPPGQIISPRTGKKIYIDYPMWVGSSEMTSLQFSRLLNYIPPGNKDINAPVTRIVWNDLLYACAIATRSCNNLSPLPDGYIVRPLTEDEYEYCAYGKSYRNGIATSTPYFGLSGMDSFVREILISGDLEYFDSYLTRGGKTPNKAEYSCDNRRELAFYQSFAPDVGTRLVVAPGSLELLQQKFQSGTPNHLVFNGKHYEFFGNILTMFNRQISDEYCKMLGGRLASIESEELLKAIRHHSSPAFYYHIQVAADFRDGKWVWANGKDVQNPPPAPREKQFFFMENSQFRLGPMSQCAGFICEWTEEEYQHRQEWKKNIPPKMLMTDFQLDDKEYILIRANGYPHLLRRYAEIWGGKLAEPETAELRKKLIEKLRPFISDRATVLLGGIWKNGEYIWMTSGNKIEEKLDIKGMISDNALSLAHPALDHDGNLCAILVPKFFLVEFPVSDSTR